MRRKRKVKGELKELEGNIQLKEKDSFGSIKEIHSRLEEVEEELEDERQGHAKHT